MATHHSTLTPEAEPTLGWPDPPTYPGGPPADPGAEAEQPEQPEAEQPEQPEAEQPEQPEQPEAEQPEQPEAEQPEAEQPEAEQPEQPEAEPTPVFANWTELVNHCLAQAQPYFRSGWATYQAEYRRCEAANRGYILR